MLLNENILLPSGPGVIKRVLEQGVDGTFLYSCPSFDSSKQQHEEIRLFEVATKRDTLIYFNDLNKVIVNASLNPGRNVIAFTTFEERKRRHSEKSTSEPKNVINPENVSPSLFHWIFPTSRSNHTIDQNGDQEKFDTVERLVEGKYASYVADVYPSSWISKFNIERSAYQKVVFTDCNIDRVLNGSAITENRLLFIMHRKKIGLYTVYLDIEKNEASYAESRRFSRDKVKLHFAPRGALIASKAFWSQWDPLRQLLYYLTVTKKKITNEAADVPHVTYACRTSLFCEQLTEHQFQQRIFVSPVDLGIDNNLLIHKNSMYVLDDMNPSVSSPSINMRVVKLENGSICLCWQAITSTPSDAFYKIAVLSKDITLHCNTEKVCERGRLSFSSFGNNILVHSSVSVMHVLAIDALPCDPWNFLYNCHYLTDGFKLGNVTSICQLPHCVPQHIDNRTGNESKCQCYLYDKNTKIISRIRIDRKCLADCYFSRKTSLENKMAMTRFATHAFNDDDNDDPAQSAFIKRFLLSFFDRDMILKGDKIIGTMLVHMVANELSQSGEIFLCNLLPIAINMPQPVLNVISLRISFTQQRDNIGNQIGKAMEKSEYTMHRWKKAHQAIKYGNYEPFDINSISEEIKLLQDQFAAKHLQEQRLELQRRLDTVFEAEGLQMSEYDIEEDEDVILHCFSSYELDYFCDNVRALTFEKLYDHLKQYMSDDTSVKLIAKNYVIGQLRAASHLIHLVLRVLEIDEHDRPLFEPVQNEEIKLLHFLKQMLFACISVNFPVPPGFQTFLTCLTFRCCLTTHLVTNDLADLGFEDSSSSDDTADDYKFSILSYNMEDIEEFSFDFIQSVDCKCIQLTDEFVARLLEELPNHHIFGPFVQQVLFRTNINAPMQSQGVLQLWKHPHSTNLLANMQMKILTEASTPVSPAQNDDDSEFENSRTGFSPLDVFLDDLKRRSEHSGIYVGSVSEATMQRTMREHGRENLKHIAC